jgi:hypothetical protein
MVDKFRNMKYDWSNGTIVCVLLLSHVSVDGKRINYPGTMAVDLEKGLEHKRKVLGLYDKSIDDKSIIRF